jgi:Mce-associated membrane protein
VADKDVKVTEATAASNGTPPAPAEPADAARPGNSDIVQSEIAGPANGRQPETGQPENGQPENGQPENGQQTPTRDSDIGQSEIEQPDDELSEAGPEPGEATPGGRQGWRVAAALGAVAVVLAGFGVWATLHASSLRSNAAAQANTALTDGPATATVRREISTAVNTIFSYNYADTAATRRAAQAVLTGPAVGQYNTLFALVTKNAPTQKLVVTTRVTNSGVELLNGNSARLLVFANQQDTRAGTGQTSYAGAMFAVTALREGGRWKIENIDTFGS